MLLVLILMFLADYYITYHIFYHCLSDDVEFRYGRKHMRNSRKKNKNKFEKFFFLDVKNKVSKWHYICFWVNFLSFFPMLGYIVFYAANDSSFGNQSNRYIFFTIMVVHYFTAAVASFAHWPLYRGNVIRNRKKYRRKYMSTRKK